MDLSSNTQGHRQEKPRVQGEENGSGEERQEREWERKTMTREAAVVLSMFSKRSKLKMRFIKKINK